MKMSDIHRFLMVKKRIPDVVQSLEEKTVTNINKVLRKCFVGKDVDSVRASIKDSNTMVIKMSKEAVRITFMFPFTNQPKTRRRRLHPILESLIDALGGGQHVAT